MKPDSALPSFRFKRKPLPMQRGIWLGLIIYGALVAIIFWIVLYTSFLRQYRDTSIRQLQNMAWNITEHYGEDNFYNMISALAQSNSSSVQVISEDQNDPVYSFSGDGAEETLQAAGLTRKEIFRQLDASDGSVFLTLDDPRNDYSWNVQLIVMGISNNSRQVLIAAHSTAEVALVQRTMLSRFGIAIVFVMLLAIFVGFLLAQFFARPFRHLNQDARRMSRGAYDTQFREEGPREARELAETLRAAETEFAATEQLRRDFVANISHDMKTPLTVIRAYAELIDSFSGDIPEKRAVHVDQIIRETDHLTGLINDMLELAKLQSGTIKLNWTWFSVTDLLQSTFERLQMRHNGESLHFSIEAKKDYEVHGDRRLLARAVYNLMNNAVKYSPDRKDIDVRIRPAGGKLLIEIRDHGIGISEEDLPNIWNRFYRAPSRSEEITGSGMGLNIVSEIFKSHHANYGAASKPGEGSTFWFVLTYKE